MADKKNVEGTWDQVKGKVKETTGVVTNDRSLEGEGKLDQVKGKVKDAFGNARDAIKDRLDDADRPSRKP